MMYTVSLPRGMSEYEFAVVIRHLVNRGGMMGHTPRVLDPVGTGRWLPVHASKAAAEAFAVALGDDLENDDWRAYAVPDAETSVGALGPIDIEVGFQGDGVWYLANSTSRRLIEECYPDAVQVPGLFISVVGPPDFEKRHGVYWPDVVRMLTGLTVDQLAGLGGYRIIHRKGGKERIYHAALTAPPVGGKNGRRRQGKGGGHGLKAPR